MPQANASKALNENFIDLADQWTNNLKVVDQVDTVPSGDYDPSVVLCTLEGILSDYGECTRNSRWYTEELWNRIINSDEFKELADTRTLFGESDHPMDIEDRVDVHYNYVSHCVRDVYLDNANQCVRGKIDVLDTPAGRIIFTFVKYGSTLGVSSRGSGDLIERTPMGEIRLIRTDEDGNEYTIDENGVSHKRDYTNRVEVDPRTYQFYAWDIVHRPSNRRARISPTLKESRTPDKMLTNLVESAKSDKGSLKWIKSLVESTSIKNKSSIVEKINEYVDMLGGEINDKLPDKLQGSERQNYEATIAKLSQDVIKLTELVAELNAKNGTSATIVSSDTSIDPSQLESLTNILQNFPKQLNESQEKSKMDQAKSADSIIASIEEVGESVLDRIDEAYNNMIKPLVTIGKTVDPFGELIKANGEFVIGAVNQAINEQSKMSIIDDSRLQEMEDELDKASSEINDLKDDNQKLEERLKSLMRSKLSESRKYLTVRCSQLGLNEKTALRQLGDIAECSFDDIDASLNEMYSSGSRSQSHARPIIQESKESINRPFGTVTLNENRKSNVDTDQLDLLGVIRNNI